MTFSPYCIELYWPLACSGLQASPEHLWTIVCLCHTLISVLIGLASWKERTEKENRCKREEENRNGGEEKNSIREVSENRKKGTLQKNRTGGEEEEMEEF